MPFIAIVCGLLLAIISVVSQVSPESLGTVPEKDSPTKWIPAAFGAILIVVGLISLAAPHLRKHAMHAGAIVGLLGLLGGLAMPIVKLAKGTLNTESAPFRSQAGMAAISVFFLFMCIRSFIAARKAREAKALTSPSD